ncbi:unnamed protein product [Fraxinus pennsylvanica]|uniref:Uncharacterized protein n=1 Tax=Fraxinus pennsylvanica TaxID=56036 RepID=A0AAD2AB97_9LAMI|nr:unnamed protein product [Fraxinus pennsylvanica]
MAIICNRRRLETNLLFLSQGFDSSSEIFQHIQMKYVDDEGIKNYFAAFHMHGTFPVSVTTENFADFFDILPEPTSKRSLSSFIVRHAPRRLPPNPKVVHVHNQRGGMLMLGAMLPALRRLRYKYFVDRVALH